jgi:Rho GTPase-activating protein 6
MRKQRNDKLKLSLECCDLATTTILSSTSTPYTQTQSQSKRNSVLYEALDLSSLVLNTKHNQQQHNQRDYITSLMSFKCDYYVPDIVKQCCLHIEKYGLNTVGIFRIDSSKKRIKEIKEIFNSGQMIILDHRYNPLDVACLLKDYLRSLPDPLLTRKLYSAFIYASSKSLFRKSDLR